jgi:nitrite reductase (cytochrome c-552)
MPYTRVGALKISDHHVRSPMLNVARSCQVCHRYGEDEIKERVATIQDRTRQLMDRALDAVVSLIGDIEQAMERGASDEQLAAARALQRRAQYRVDFINAENSMGFHAPQEAARVLGEAIDYARQGQVTAAQVAARRGAAK